EPDSKSIAGFAIVTIISLVVVIGAIQFYFNTVWGSMVQERVLDAPAMELRDLRALEQWRATHYEFPDAAKSRVRIPLDQAKDLCLKDAAAGKTFYPGKPTEPKPETPGGDQAAAGDQKGKQ